MTSKLITVFGASGAQGSSVCRSLAANTKSPFTLRGITRNPGSAASESLKKSVPGIEIVQADGWDKDGMIAAFRGSWGAFVNTNSDDPVFENAEETRTELDLGKIIVDAAVEAGVKVFVYSGFNSAKEISGGKVPAPAFDEKNAIGKYAISTNSFEAVVIASPGWYIENFLVEDLAPVLGGFPLIPSQDDTFVLRSPKWGGKEDVPFISITEDYGDIVHGVFLDPTRWNGRLVQGVSDIQSFGDVVEKFERVTGKKSRFEEIPNWRDFDTYGVHALETVKLMFGFCQESSGKYFGETTEASTALDLKKKASIAKGLDPQGVTLASLEEFFTRNFATK